MGKSNLFFPGVISGIVISTMLFMFMADMFGDDSVFYAHGYKQGQIDHANNIVMYELVKQKDGTTVWKKVEGSK